METIINKSLPENCRLAIPKKGRLHDKVVLMLKGAGLEFHRAPRLDVALCLGALPVTIVFLPASDIATFVGEGNIDIGITGIDIFEESDVSVDRIMNLGFGKCKLCVLAERSKNLKGNVSALAGKRIVTSFPNLAKKYFAPYDKELGVTTRIKFVSGSVEAACTLGLADGVVDLVETGTTMRAAGLEIVSEVLQTEAILIANPDSAHKDTIKLIERRIKGYITATMYSMISYNVHVDILSKAEAITPGKRSPTVTGLEDSKYKSVSSLVLKKEISEKMDQLHEIGATDILVIELSNSLIL